MHAEIQKDDVPLPPTIADTARPGVLLLPGLGDSGPRHWQSHWQALGRFKKVDFQGWANPKLHEWLPVLDRAVRESPRPVVLAAHSLGCLAASWWATLFWSEAFREKVAGALLVAPPDVDAVDAEPRIRDFRPLPLQRLPFRSVVVASRDDPYSTFARSVEMARRWGSELVDAGPLGHINADSRVGEWTCGLRILSSLTGHNPNMLIAELGLRKVFA